MDNGRRGVRTIPWNVERESHLSRGGGAEQRALADVVAHHLRLRWPVWAMIACSLTPAAAAERVSFQRGCRASAVPSQVIGARQ